MQKFIGLQFLLQKMLRLMRRLVIHMHIRPIHIRQTLQLHLQFLRHIMRRPQRLVLIHHNINLDDQPGPRMPTPYRVKRFDVLTVRHTDVRDELKHFGAGGLADQELELGVCGMEPETGYEDGKEDGTHGIDPPCKF